MLHTVKEAPLKRARRKGVYTATYLMIFDKGWKRLYRKYDDPFNYHYLRNGFWVSCDERIWETI